MGVLTSVLTVLFIIVCIRLIIIILLQTDKSSGMGLLGGSSQSAFGSSTADVITKITAVMVAIFLIGALGLAVFQSLKSKSLEKEFMSGSAAGVVSKPAENKTPEAPKEGQAK